MVSAIFDTLRTDAWLIAQCRHTTSVQRRLWCSYHFEKGAYRPMSYFQLVKPWRVKLFGPLKERGDPCFEAWNFKTSPTTLAFLGFLLMPGIYLCSVFLRYPSFKMSQASQFCCPDSFSHSCFLWMPRPAFCSCHSLPRLSFSIPLLLWFPLWSNSVPLHQSVRSEPPLSNMTVNRVGRYGELQLSKGSAGSAGAKSMIWWWEKTGNSLSFINVPFSPLLRPSGSELVG